MDHLAQGSAPVSVGNPLLNISIFAVFVVVTLVVVFQVGRASKTASDYYAAGRSFTGAQNGIAISGDYLSAASFLGIAGAIAVTGYDGFLYSIGFLVAWLVALLLVAELLRNTGKYTMGDVLSFRMRQRPVRAAAATSTLVVSFFYLFAQMAGAGALIALLLKIPNTNVVGQGAVIAIVGILMIIYVLVGGMRGTTWVQIIKAALLLVGTALITIWVLALFGFSLSAVLGQAVSANPVLETAGQTKPLGEKLLGPGLQYGATATAKIDFISLSLALVLGTAGLPHILMRFYTVPSAKEARRSVVWAIWLIGIFYLFTLVLGYGAAALVPGGATTIANAPGKTNSAAPLLAYVLGGEVLLGLISAVAFATILAVVAGLTITASASFAHDVYANVIKRGEASAGLRGAGGPDHGGRDRRDRHCRRHPRPQSEHRVPGRAGFRRCGVGQPADDPVHAVLEAVQHHRRPLEHLRRAGQLRVTDHLLAGGVREPCSHAQGRGLPRLPAGQPRPGVDPAVVPAGRHRHVRRQAPAGRRGQVRRDGSPVAHRRRGGEGGLAVGDVLAPVWPHARAGRIRQRRAAHIRDSLLPHRHHTAIIAADSTRLGVRETRVCRPRDVGRALVLAVGDGALEFWGALRDV